MIQKPPPLDDQRQKHLNALRVYVNKMSDHYKYVDPSPDVERMLTNIGAWIILIEGDESW